MSVFWYGLIGAEIVFMWRYGFPFLLKVIRSCRKHP